MWIYSWSWSCQFWTFRDGQNNPRSKMPSISSLGISTHHRVADIHTWSWCLPKSKISRFWCCWQDKKIMQKSMDVSQSTLRVTWKTVPIIHWEIFSMAIEAVQHLLSHRETALITISINYTAAKINGKFLCKMPSLVYFRFWHLSWIKIYKLWLKKMFKRKCRKFKNSKISIEIFNIEN